MRLRMLPLTLVLLTALPLGALADALMKGLSYPGQWLPLEEVAVEITTVDQVVTTVVDHTFNNETDTFQDVTYYFPLPDEATVVGFGMWINDELHYFDLEPGEQGGGGGDVPGGSLGDYLGPNPFKQAFEDLAPGPVTLRLEYTELMTYEFGLYRFAYPTEVPPWTIDPVGLTNLTVSGSSQRDLQGLSVPEFPSVQYEYVSPDSFRISYADEMSLIDRDFEVQIEVDTEDVGMWVMSHRHADGPDPGHYLAVIEPGDVADGDALQKAFTFVLDKSGSMSGQPILEAKQAAIYCIEHLDNDDWLNLVAFDGAVWTWNPNPVPANDANKAAAINWLQSLSAGGSTNLNGAMETALNQDLNPAHANQILLLSDGMPTSGVTSLPTILTNIGENNTVGASIFTVAAGPAADLTFLNLIGYQNAGLSIQVENLANLAEEIETFFLRFSSPVLTNVVLSPDNPELGWDEVYPPAPYTLFAGSQTIIAGQYDIPGSTTVTMQFSVGGVQDEVEYGPFEFTEADTTTYSFVPRMWAIRKIDYWIAWMAVYGEDDDIVQMIIDLSLQYGILTPYTDYDVAVEETHHLTATAAWERSGVRVTWSLRPMVSDAAFDVYRRESGSSSWLKLNREPVRGGSYLDVTAETGVGYTYKVVLAEGDVAVRPAEVSVRAAGHDGLVLEGATPNPFNASTRIRFSLAEPMRVTLTVHDILGREVAQLVRGRREAGRHEVAFDGSRMASGLYFVRVEASGDGAGTSLSRASRIMLVK